METIVLVTGGFDPIHSGHIQYFQAARKLGNRLVVAVNSDTWLARKKGRAFMTWSDRSAVVGALGCVDQVIDFNDDDDSALDAIRIARQCWPQAHIIFANGGDRNINNIPEMSGDIKDIEFRFGVGGDYKANSSSWILDEWRAPKTPRPWGYYRVLHEHAATVKVKELTVEPGQALSMQRHRDRNEFWFVTQGSATVYSLGADTDFYLLGEYHEHDYVWIDGHQWHQLRNETDQDLRIIEIQFGAQCAEDDIERH